jgi:hypothetical protein
LNSVSCLNLILVAFGFPPAADAKAARERALRLVSESRAAVEEAEVAELSLDRSLAG